MRFTPSAEYAFHHPLIRAVAYESQLKSDRAEVHRRLAAAIESSSAGISRPKRRADRRTSGGRGRPPSRIRVAHARSYLVDHTVTSVRRGSVGNGPAKSPTHCPMTTRAAPRCESRPARCCAAPAGESMLTSPAIFEELRELCALAGDKASLALGMTGMVMDHMMHGRLREASQLASEQMALLESIGDPALTVGAGSMAILDQVPNRGGRRRTAVVADGHRLGRRRPHQGQSRRGLAAGVSACVARRCTILAGA